ncbi:A/G-specific adenine glycosylase [Marinicauda salina]|uniref:Adenine DNA glycosylase n=1 Tax=Marinicauda salina TaxID=2135793 RepID=A0A2U2BV57_9PROT|nr:A/G-specific adenine glycosylase [Marinicauda salina]
MRAALLDWYDRQGRTLPWRVRPEDRAAGRIADPYAVWLSEIMLQQTTVAHAAPYWEKFLERWPTVEALAAAPREAVMAAWAGLGYYARARNLHACAQVVASEHGGRFPSDLDALRALPGIGEYTANAVRAAAFDKPASVVDGNVERVLARMFAIETPLPKAKREIKAIAAELADPERPGDYAQAIMDLGATACAPASPHCAGCPWRDACAARADGEPERYPVKAKKKAKPVRRGVCFHVVRDGALWVRRRPDDGLLGAMMELPGTGWTEAGPAPADIAAARPFDADWRRAGRVRHVFTHFALELDVECAAAPAGWRPPEGEWAGLDRLKEAGLPSVMMKAAQSGLTLV